MADFNKAIAKTLVYEGGYVNDPDDAGGETKFGISKRSYPNVDIKNLTEAGAKKIYKDDYWDRIRCDEIKSQIIAFNIFDTAVNMGVRTASKLIQGSAQINPDGVIGNISLKTINDMDEEVLALRFKLAKIARYLFIVKRKPTNKKYIVGWLNRVMEA